MIREKDKELRMKGFFILGFLILLYTRIILGVFKNVNV